MLRDTLVRVEAATVRSTRSRSARAPRHARTPRGQRGASTAMALGVLIFLTVVIGALVGFTNTSLKATSVYKDLRNERYAGDGVIKAAINWAKDNPNVAVNPDYYQTVDGKDANGQCVYQMEDPNIGPVAASCYTSPDSNSGIPAQQGEVPPEALLLLGQRHNEPGPYSTNGCTTSTVAAAIQDFATWLTGTAFPWVGSSEKSMNVNVVKRRGPLGNCIDYNHDVGTFAIKGDVVAAGKVTVGAGSLSVFNTDPTKRGTITAKASQNGQVACAGNIQRMLGSNSASGCDAWPSAATHGPNSVPKDVDPARSAADKQTPIGDIAESYVPVGFQADGSPRGNYTIAGAPYPNVVKTMRTTAYQFVPGYADADTTVPLGLKPIPTCVGLPSNSTVVFLPGWYKNAQVLNRYTANQGCKDRTIWFAPDAGPDRSLLTSDDQTGPFYMDFNSAGFTGPTTSGATVDGVGTSCGGLTTVRPARWCIGGTFDAETRVVVGTPSGWSPLGSTTAANPGGGTGGNPTHGGGRVNVSMPTATTVDDVDAGDWLRFLIGGPWVNLNKAKTFGDNGVTGPNAGYATYQPCKVDFLGIFQVRCPSLGTRTVRLAEFTPKATGGPIGDDDTATGRIKIEVEYGLNATAVNSAQIDKPVLEIETIDTLGRTKQCGSYGIGEKAAHLWEPGYSSPMPVTAISDADQVRLAAACGSKVDINSYRVYLKVGGNRTNSQDPRVYLGGVKVSFDSYNGARFPYPDSTAVPDARSDCDANAEAGGQLIFGGDSHLYVADGSLEVCAGVYPGGPSAASSHQVIGIYGVPANRSLKVVDFQSPRTNGNNMSEMGGPWSTSTATRLRIGEPDLPTPEAYWGDLTSAQKGNVLGFDFGKNCGAGLCDPEYGAGRVNVKVEPFTVPTGYKVQKVAARASFRNDSTGNSRFCTKGAVLAALTSGCKGFSDGIKMPDGNVSQGPFLSKVWTQFAERPEFVLYDAATGVNRMEPDWSSKLTGGVQLSWEGRIPCPDVVGVPTCVGTSTDSLDGIEVDVTIVPTSTTEPWLRPESGCITAHPNYSGGAADPDCAIVRANMWDTQSSGNINLVCSLFNTNCDDTLRGSWQGRLSVKGTIYAPAAALEVDDQDVAYPFATRGAILRNLTVSGWRARPGYTQPAVTNQIDRTPATRVTKFTACTQVSSRRGLPCDNAQGDSIITEAGVSFVVPAGGTAANVPQVNWWSDKRAGSS